MLAYAWTPDSWKVVHTVLTGNIECAYSSQCAAAGADGGVAPRDRRDLRVRQPRRSGTRRMPGVVLGILDERTVVGDLRIEKIDVFRLELPSSGGLYHLSGGRKYRSFDTTLVRVTAQSGLEGWGESTPLGPNYFAAHALGVGSGIEEIVPQLLGLNSIRVDRSNDAMDSALIGHEIVPRLRPRTYGSPTVAVTATKEIR